MFKNKIDRKTSKNRKSYAGKKVYERFVKKKTGLNKNQHLMIRDMAYFEALYNETLNDPRAKVESVEGLKKGREAMRMSLKISPKSQISLLVKHLIKLLETKDFFLPKEKKHSMIVNINNLIYRLEPNDKELRILASIISSLGKKNQ